MNENVEMCKKWQLFCRLWFSDTVLPLLCMTAVYDTCVRITAGVGEGSQ